MSLIIKVMCMRFRNWNEGEAYRPFLYFCAEDIMNFKTVSA